MLPASESVEQNNVDPQIPLATPMLIKIQIWLAFIVLFCISCSVEFSLALKCFAGNAIAV